MQKKLAIAMASVFTLIAPVAHGAYDRYGNWYDDSRQEYTPSPFYAPSTPVREEFARVLETRPVYDVANRREECWNPRAGHYEERREQREANVNKGAVAGALLGGVLGHQVDSGAGGTLGGALIGGLIGNQVEKGRDSDRQDDLDYSRCRVVAEGGRNLQGYDVRYVYRGQEYTTRMAQAPGRRLLVGEDIREDGTPIEY